MNRKKNNTQSSFPAEEYQVTKTPRESDISKLLSLNKKKVSIEYSQFHIITFTEITLSVNKWYKNSAIPETCRPFIILSSPKPALHYQCDRR